MARKKVTRVTKKQETAKKVAAEPVKTTSAVKTAEEKAAPVANEVSAEKAELETKTVAVGAVKRCV